MKKIGLLSLMAVMGLFLSFCAKTTPTTDGENPSAWEKLPQVNTKWINPKITVKMATDKAPAPAGEDVAMEYGKTPWDDTTKELTFKPATAGAKFKGVLERSTTAGLIQFDLTYTVDIDKTHPVPAHIYFNDKYIETDNGNGGGAPGFYEPGKSTTPVAMDLVSKMTKKDSLYIILEYWGTDGTHYQYKTPVIRVADAS